MSYRGGRCQVESGNEEGVIEVNHPPGSVVAPASKYPPSTPHYTENTTMLLFLNRLPLSLTRSENTTDYTPCLS